MTGMYSISSTGSIFPYVVTTAEPQSAITCTSCTTVHHSNVLHSQGLLESTSTCPVFVTTATRLNGKKQHDGQA